MSFASSPTRRARCGSFGLSPSRSTRTGSKPTATSTWKCSASSASNFNSWRPPKVNSTAYSSAAADSDLASAPELFPSGARAAATSPPAFVNKPYHFFQLLPDPLLLNLTHTTPCGVAGTDARQRTRRSESSCRGEHPRKEARHKRERCRDRLQEASSVHSVKIAPGDSRRTALGAPRSRRFGGSFHEPPIEEYLEGADNPIRTSRIPEMPSDALNRRRKLFSSWNPDRANPSGFLGVFEIPRTPGEPHLPRNLHFCSRT